MAITIYLRAGCPYCDALRRELDERDARYTAIDVDERPEVVPELLKLTGGRRIVPVLVQGTEVKVAPNGGEGF